MLFYIDILLKGFIMNKELVKKYKTEFKWWVEGGLILWMDSTGIWDNGDSVWENCNYSDAVVIIDDEYSKFRRALAEGKTLEVFNVHYYKQLQNNTWVNMDTMYFDTTISVEHYRIKPDKPKFKAGDWVRDTRIGMKNPVVQLKPNCIALTDPAEYAAQYVLWHPKEGDWCWFYAHIEGEHLSLGKFLRRKGESYVYYDIALDKEVITFYCEPFIGTLPSIIKD